MTERYGYCEVQLEVTVLRHGSPNRKYGDIMSVLPKLRADTRTPVLVSASLSITNKLRLTNICYAGFQACAAKSSLLQYQLI
jgi:hypothetical protein